MAVLANKGKVARKALRMNPLSVFRRRKQNYKVASAETNSDAEFSSGRNSEARSGFKVQKSSVVASENVSASDTLSLAPARRFQHRLAGSGMFSKGANKEMMHGSRMKQSFGQNRKNQEIILALRLSISFSTMVLILSSELLRGWKRFQGAVSFAMTSLNRILADILFVIMDLAFGLFVISLYGRELSAKPLALAFDELERLLAYLVESNHFKYLSNECKLQYSAFVRVLEILQVDDQEMWI